MIFSIKVDAEDYYINELETELAAIRSIFSGAQAVPTVVKQVGYLVMH